MKENNVNFFKRFNVLPKIFCILVAFLIWLYVTAVESPDHEETITFVPIELVGASTIESEHNLSVVSGRDIKIDLVVRGQQSTISKYNVDDYNVIADISGLNSAGRYTIDLHFDMPSGVTLSSASSNSIEVYVDEKVSASIEVRPSVIYSSEYTVGEYELDYDVITVSGPKKYVDEVGYAEVSVNAGKITSTTTLSGALSLKSKSNIPMTSPYLSLSRSEVKVTIPVFVTKEVEVRVPYKHGFYTEGTAITRVEPSTVTIEGDPAALSKVDYIYTTMVDEKEVDESLTLNLALQIPDNVHLSRSEKGTVNVSIQHKGTEKKRLSISSKRFEVVGADAVNYDILSDSLTISVRGKSEVLKALKEDSFKVIIDLTGYDVESAIVDVPYTVEFDTESYKAYVIGSNDDNIKVKIG